MKRKGIIVALVILIGLGLYVYFVERERPVSGETEIVLSFDKEKASRLIINQDGKEIILNRDREGDWYITSPLNARADDSVIKGMVSDLSDVNAFQGMEIAPCEWEDFGLKKPECEVSVLIEGEGEQRISFGTKNPAGTSTYARIRGKDKIFLVSSYLSNSFKKEVFDLRNKTVLSIEKDKVEKVELIYPEKRLAFEREKEDTWVKSGEERIELDIDRINDILWDITDIKAKGFAGEDVKDLSLAQYGLDKPGVKAVITAGGRERTIIFGNEAREKKDTVYAQLSGDPRLFLVSGTLPSRLKKDISDLKKKEDKATEEESNEVKIYK